MEPRAVKNGNKARRARTERGSRKEASPRAGSASHAVEARPWLPRDPAHRAALGMLTALAVALRTVHLFQPMRYDEAFAFNRFASQSFVAALTGYDAPNNHLLHTALMRAVYLVAGDAPWVLRTPAYLAGVLIVPATYLVARRLYSDGVALAAAALVTASSPLILYASNSRGYSLVALVFLALVMLGLQVEGRRTPGAWLAFVLLAALGFWTIPTMLFAFGGVALWLAHRSLRGPHVESRPDLRWLIGACLAVAVITVTLYAPVIHRNGMEAVVANRYVASQPFADFVRATPQAVAGLWRSWHEGMPLALQALLGAGAILSVALGPRAGREPRALVTSTLASCALLLLLIRRHPFERVWLFLLPGYLTLGVAGCAVLLAPLSSRWTLLGKRGLLPALSVASAAFLGWRVVETGAVTRSEETGLFPEAEEIVEFLAARYHEPGRELILTDAPPVNETIMFYWQRQELPMQEMDDSELRRVFVVVRDGSERRAAEIFAGEPTPLVGFSSLRVARRFGAAAVYVASR